MAKMISDLLGLRPIKGQYGIEVEAEFSEPTNYEEVHHLWYTTGDGSLRGFGVEFISPKPWDKETAKESYAFLLAQSFWQNYFRASPRAGIHVHCNVTSWSVDRVLRFLVAYYLVEEVMLHNCGEDRKGNLFCLRMNDADSVLDAVQDLIDHKLGDLRRNFNTYKYAALNIASIGKLGSVEFRALPSNGSIQEFSDWLDMIDNLSEYSKKEQSLEDVYREWNRDRAGFALEVLGKLPENCDLYELLDVNRSNAYRIITLYNSREERGKALMRKEKALYSFPSSERAVDVGEEIFEF